MRNPLQDQLLKSGLAKKSKLAQVVREQTKQRQGKSTGPAPESGDAPSDARQIQAQRVERDRALAAQTNARARSKEIEAQVRQIVQAHRIVPVGEIEYRFSDRGKFHVFPVSPLIRSQLASGAAVIVRHADGYEILPRPAARMVRQRMPEAIVVDNRAPGELAVDNGTPGAQSGKDSDDDFYARFQVPDDLIW